MAFHGISEDGLLNLCSVLKQLLNNLVRHMLNFCNDRLTYNNTDIITEHVLYEL